uniref:G-protein coupled receptors family 1 profile domain-containing protein n=1 Tax=Globodera rostochiensis TaxID=31243 RepID=A0A914HZU7_GLORO
MYVRKCVLRFVKLWTLDTDWRHRICCIDNKYLRRKKMSALNAANASTNVTIGNEIIYVPFAISIFGLIGNAVAFLTIVLSDLRKNYVNIYLLVLLCSDSVLLLDFFLQPLFRFDVLNFWTI